MSQGPLACLVWFPRSLRPLWCVHIFWFARVWGWYVAGRVAWGGAPKAPALVRHGFLGGCCVPVVQRDVNDPPTLFSAASFGILENSTVGAVVYTVVAADEDIGDTCA
jgi:hypothetical protein